MRDAAVGVDDEKPRVARSWTGQFAAIMRGSPQIQGGHVDPLLQRRPQVQRLTPMQRLLLGAPVCRPRACYRAAMVSGSSRAADSGRSSVVGFGIVRYAPARCNA